MSAASALKRSDLSQLDYTLDLLYGLSDDDLKAVQAVAIALNNKYPTNISGDVEHNSIEPFMPQTEHQLIRRIDHSLAQIDRGEYSDAEEVEKEMLAEIRA